MIVRQYWWKIFLKEVNFFGSKILCQIWKLPHCTPLPMYICVVQWFSTISHVFQLQIIPLPSSIQIGGEWSAAKRYTTAKIIVPLVYVVNYSSVINRFFFPYRKGKVCVAYYIKPADRWTAFTLNVTSNSKVCFNIYLYMLECIIVTRLYCIGGTRRLAH